MSSPSILVVCSCIVIKFALFAIGVSPWRSHSGKSSGYPGINWWRYVGRLL